MADVNPKIVVLLRVGRSPHIAKYLLVRNHPTNVRNQKREQPVFNGCEMNFSPSASHNYNVTSDLVNYIPVVNWLGSSQSGTRKELVILFDRANVVQRFSMSESKVKVKTGLFNN